MTEQVINSRTFSINGEFDSALLGDYNVDVTTTESGRVFIQCDSLDDAAKVYTVLVDGGYRTRIVSYSLYYKSTDGVFENEENVRELFNTICPHANIIYMRLNNDNVSGKLVVDTLADYQVFKAQNAIEEAGIQFFHFNTRNSRKGKVEHEVVEEQPKVEKKAKKTTKTVKKTKRSVVSDV